jgi:hypothetical protein
VISAGCPKKKCRLTGQIAEKRIDAAHGATTPAQIERWEEVMLPELLLLKIPQCFNCQNSLTYESVFPILPPQKERSNQDIHY